MWDVIVVGTGMGGATLGYELARAGKRVLFVEKGIVDGSIRGMYPESSPGYLTLDTAQRAQRLLEGGRSIDEVADGRRTFTPFIGAGGGGSTALFGMVMERLFAEDFAPRAQYRDADSTLPETWPVSYTEMALWYARAESLYHVRGTPDPLRDDNGTTLRAPPPLSATSEVVASVLRGQGLHPYTLHLACDDVAACDVCQGMRCARGCKRDAATTCLLPAIREHGAEVVDRATVLGVEAERTRVTGVVVERDGKRETLRGRHIVLAAGALMTPAILLNSRLANASDQVGRNVMRHTMEFLFLRDVPRLPEGAIAKDLSFNDFYLPGARSENRKLGTVQSLGRLPSGTDVLGQLPAVARMLVRPFADQLWNRHVRSRTVLAAIMEDLPHAQNRVTPGNPFADGARQRVNLQYRLSRYDLDRAATFHLLLMRALEPLRPRALQLARRNTAIAHVCGTCRFGDDPASSVLDRNNRAHDLDNLYVVDASFFPSSSGANPALTIAANALRVAAHLRERL